MPGIDNIRPDVVAVDASLLIICLTFLVYLWSFPIAVASTIILSYTHIYVVFYIENIGACSIMRVMQASVIPLLVVLLVTQCYLVGMSLLVTGRYQSHVQASEYMHNIGDVVFYTYSCHWTLFLCNKVRLATNNISYSYSYCKSKHSCISIHLLARPCPIVGDVSLVLLVPSLCLSVAIVMCYLVRYKEIYMVYWGSRPCLYIRVLL